MLSLLILPGNGFFLDSAQVWASTTLSAATNLVTSPVANITSFFKWLFGGAPPQHDTLADRINAVSRLQISPNKFVGYQGQSLTFAAQGLNISGNVVQGVRFSWESSDTDKVQINDAGQARFLQPGLARITCRAGFVSATVPILVRPGGRPPQTDDEWNTDQHQLQADGTVSTGVGSAFPSVPQWFEKLMPTVHAQNNGGNSDFGYDELWNDPKNLIGLPLNRVTDSSRIGAVLTEGSNFEFAVPIISLGGRGLGANLTLFYNSRVWTKRNSAMAYDAVNGEPSPGFSLGFGRIITYGTSSTKYVLIDPDGTRHYLGTGSFSSSSTYTTTDGSDITFTGCGQSGGALYFKDGTSVAIQVVNNRLLPTSITDSNGNYVTITYKTTTCDPNCGCGCQIQWPALKIDYITDTMGRQIQCNYDANFNLTSITAPGFGGTAQNPVTTTIARFDYQTMTATYNFSGLTVEKTPLNNTAYLKHVYFPATNNGYLFSYSGYGMIYNVSLRKEMSYSTSITDGNERAAVSFNYPTSGSTQLTDAPAFTSRTETALNAPSATFTYSSTTDPFNQTKTFTTTLPDSSTINLTRSTNSSSVDNGLLTKTEIKNSSGTTFAKSVITYATSASAPRVQNIITYDDTNTPSKVDMDYDGYGNVVNTRQYGQQISGQWQVRRRTKLTYKTDTAYVNAYLRSLVIERDVYDAKNNTNDTDDALISKSTVTYDDYNAMNGMEVYTGKPEAPQHLSNYDATVTVRGNVTGTTAWYDIAGNQSITRLKKIDKYGSVVQEQVACCQVKSMTCSDTNGYAVPDCVMSGDASGTHTMEDLTTDYNTGLLTVQAGPNAAGSQNNLTTTFSYDAANRLSGVTSPSGAQQIWSVNDSNLSVSVSANYTESTVNKTLTGTMTTDGWGRSLQLVNKANNQVNMSYDSMGRMQSKSNPFPSGQTPAPDTTYQYDVLGRLTQTTMPDGNTSQISYSGTMTTTTDPVSRKMREERDSLGRLTKVTEQDNTGALAQDTNLTYDLLDNLTQVDQGGQYRTYKYDALGRLLYERIPEQSATINDGTGTFWTTKYTYTNFNEVATKTDARGVIITNGYDALNRLTSVTYDTSGASGVASTPSETYTYDTSQTSSTNGKLLSVSIGGSNVEEYTYDSHALLASVKHLIGAYQYTTNYQRNTLGQVIEMTYPSTRVLDYFRDSYGRFKQVGGTGSQGNGYNNGFLNYGTYNAAGQMTGFTLGNGITEAFTYDTQRQQLTNDTATKSGSTLMNLTYNYSAQAGQNGTNTTAGNSGSIMGTSGTINANTESSSFTYDVNKRLVTSTQTTNGTTTQRRFAYDRWGNRTGAWDATSGGNQIQSVTLQQSGSVPTNRITSVTTNGVTKNFSYDAAGNVTNDGSHTYTYDAKNRIVSVDSGTYTYSYDHKNRRIKKVSGSATTHYVWDGDQVIAEHNGANGAVLIDYIYFGNRMVAKVQGGSTKYLLEDQLSIRATSDSNGSVVGQQGHLPYGEGAGNSGSVDKHQFTNYERDETDLDYAVNRHYSMDVGKFRSIDPKSGNVSKPQSLNRYAYVSNDPINSTDPQGSESVESCKARDQVYDAGEDACVDPPDIGDTSVNVSGKDGETIDPGDDSDPFSGDGNPGGETGQQGLPGFKVFDIPPSPGDPLKLLDDFWKTKAGQHCKEVLGNVSLGGGVNVLGQLVTNIKSTTFIDLHLSENVHYLNETWAQAGWTPPSLVDPNSPIGNYLGRHGSSFALTWAADGRIVFGLDWGTASDHSPTSTVLHELLHTVFDLMDRGRVEYHEFVGRQLNIPEPKDGNWTKALNHWIDNGCK